jgi:hypothetical protein
MKKRTLKADTPQFLSGWKEIANFLGMGVRTVQRYEREMGLPVRRPAGKVRGSVVAISVELDGWVKASPIREVFRLRVRPRYPSSAQEIKAGLSELARLREQTAALRADMKESLQRLHDSVCLLQEELQQRRVHEFPSLYSWNERDLIERTASKSSIQH